MDIENYEKIKSLNYELNNDGTFKITCVAINSDDEEIFMVYPKVKVDWCYPKRKLNFMLPIPTGFQLLSD